MQIWAGWSVHDAINEFSVFLIFRNKFLICLNEREHYIKKSNINAPKLWNEMSNKEIIRQGLELDNLKYTLTAHPVVFFEMVFSMK